MSKEQVNYIMDMFKDADEMVVKTLLEELGEVRFGEAREALLSVINDFTYDIDSENALAQLFTEDEFHAFENYMISNGVGVQIHSDICGGCKKRLVSLNVPIVVFKCGHCFHNDPNCLKSNKCPICENIVSDEKDQLGKGKTNNKLTISHIARFERSISLKPNSVSIDFYSPPTDKDQNPIETPTATILPLEPSP